MSCVLLLTCCSELLTLSLKTNIDLTGLWTLFCWHRKLHNGGRLQFKEATLKNMKMQTTCFHFRNKQQIRHPCWDGAISHLLRKSKNSLKCNLLKKKNHHNKTPATSINNTKQVQRKHKNQEKTPESQDQFCRFFFLICSHLNWRQRPLRCDKPPTQRRIK